MHSSDPRRASTVSRGRVARTLAATVALLLGLGALGAASANAAGTTGAAAGGAASATPAQLFAGGLYVERTSDAATAVTRLRAAGDTASADLLRRISETPTAVWLGEWFTGSTLRNQIAKHVTAARQQGATPVFVTYAVPNRDCGGHSAGGMTAAGYAEWNRIVASSLTGTGAVVLVEPDGLAMLTEERCPGERPRRIAAISSAVDILTAAGLTVYLDAGHSKWRTPADMASLLNAAGIAKTRGFVTNVSNYQTLASEKAYAEKLSALVGGAHFVVDVSRNGTGWRGDWCNPPGASIGQTPAVTFGFTKLDAVLWVKHPGASDGTCNGGPAAGAWWDAYALDLVRNSANASGVSAEAAYVCRAECG